MLELFIAWSHGRHSRPSMDGVLMKYSAMHWKSIYASLPEARQDGFASVALFSICQQCVFASVELRNAEFSRDSIHCATTRAAPRVNHRMTSLAHHPSNNTWLAGAVWNANEPPNNVTAWIKIGIFNSCIRFSQQLRQVHRGIAFKNTIRVVEAQFNCWRVYFHLFTFSTVSGISLSGTLIVESLSRGKN